MPDPRLVQKESVAIFGDGILFGETKCCFAGPIADLQDLQARVGHASGNPIWVCVHGGTLKVGVGGRGLFGFPLIKPDKGSGAQKAQARISISG